MKKLRKIKSTNTIPEISDMEPLPENTVQADSKSFKKLQNKSYSQISLWLAFLIILGINLNFREWEKPYRILQDDVHQYYIYLPATFVHHDLSFDFFLTAPQEYIKKLYMPKNEATGVRIPKMSMGMAMVYAPFFLATHYVVVPLTGLPPDVYSMPYKIALVIASLSFLLLGLWFLRKILLQYFSDKVVAVTLFIVAMGTNIIWYTTHEHAMSHVFSFSLIILMTYYVKKWLGHPTVIRSLLLGMLFGLIVLIRPVNIVFGVIILLVPFDDEINFGRRVGYIVRKWQYLVIMIAGYMLVWAPQLIFWKYASGHWFHYTYGDEGFFFGNPQVFSSWFSWRKGWLVYTPLMLLSITGLPLLYRKNRGLMVLTLVILILAAWVNSSWWCWWFGGSFGNRAYIDAYGIFAIGIAASIEALFSVRNKIVRMASGILILFFIFFNLFQHWQYRYSIINYVAMTKEAYFKSLFKTQFSSELEDLFVFPDHEAGKKGMYYPLHEVSVGEKRKRNERIMNHSEYIIKYLKNKAINDKSLMKEVLDNSANKEDTTLALSVWAESEINRMLSN